MTDLIWKPEKEKLRDKRSIIMPSIELLMDTLEHDYTKPSWGEGPRDPIEVRYYWSRRDRGAAWEHLMQNPPIIEVERDGETERFKPLFEPKKHPYRKAHGADYWGWAVYKWELIPSEEACPSTVS